MENIFVEFLPPWVETGIQPAFYDKESGTVLQQTARMYARVNMLIRMFNKLSKETKETVDHYVEEFTTLYNYVHDYFDNLDVQEEIDHKLDDMVEAGTLQEIITSYLDTKAIFSFDTVADLKDATNLMDGSYAETYGYHVKGDYGGANYKIRTKTDADTPDDMTLIAIGDDLVAELVVIDGYVTPEMFGAYGDNDHDDTDAIQSALDFYEVVHFTKTYSITTIDVPSNAHLKGSGTIIGSTQGKMINLIGTIPSVKTNIVIEGLNFKHSDVTFTQQAFIIYIRYAQDVTIKNCNFTHWTGDAICMDNFQSTQKLTQNIFILNNKFINEHTGRQAISILTASHVNIKDNIFEDTTASGMPGAIDIEPWYNGESGDLIEYVIEDINIDGNYCKNSVYNTAFVNVYVGTSQNMYDINIANNTIDNNNQASGIKLQTESGTLSGTKNVYIGHNTIKAPFQNILVSGFDAVVESNNITDGVVTFGAEYVTNKLPITNLKFIKNTYNTTSANRNTEPYILGLNLDTDSVVNVCDNYFNMGDTTSSSWIVYCIKNNLYTGNSDPTIKPIYSNNKFIYTGTKNHASFGQYSYGIYSDNEILNGSSNTSLNLYYVHGSNTYSIIASNITKIDYTDKFTPTTTDLETVRTITIPANSAYSISVYSTINNTNIKQLVIEKGGSWVADSGASGTRDRRSACYSGMSGNSSVTITIKAAFDALNWNNVMTTGYIIKPTYSSSQN